MVFKLVISDPKTGKSYNLEVEDTKLLIGKKIGEKVHGSLFNLPDYELQITGGSDKIGNPMRADVEGAGRRITLTRGVGFRAKRKGERRKKRVHGRAISSDIVQVNMKVVKIGSKSLDELLGATKKADGDKTQEKTKEKQEPEKTEDEVKETKEKFKEENK